MCQRSELNSSELCSLPPYSMDVDPTPESSQVTLPKIDEAVTLDSKTPKQRALELLDILEGHVEKLRRDAYKLEEDRDALLASLDSVRSADIMTDIVEYERDDIHRYADRVITRCLTVEVRVLTHRDKMQEEALHQVNSLIDSLVMGLRVDPDATKARCISYMNACSSHYVQGVTDKNFESALLGCTLDDQKRVKKRLQGLLSYFDRLNVETLS